MHFFKYWLTKFASVVPGDIKEETIFKVPNPISNFRNRESVFFWAMSPSTFDYYKLLFLIKTQEIIILKLPVGSSHEKRSFISKDNY